MTRQHRRRRFAAPPSARAGDSAPGSAPEPLIEPADHKPVAMVSGEQSAVHRKSGKLISRVWLQRVAPLLVVVVALLVYGNALQNGFVLDDGPVVLRNPLVHSIDGLWRAFTESYWPPPSQGGQYRPLGTISFTLDWAISGGDPRWFHAVNVLWHAAAALLVWYVALQLLAPAAALVAALLFAVHPVHVEAVANLVGRLEPMAAV
ncbi:MAG TPA: hypothetical protein VMM77_08110, partial [Gemmatimonadaceae bacterium]|nr:hypothetical protein [Gemmatimonadaceae bacterium]